MADSNISNLTGPNGLGLLKWSLGAYSILGPFALPMLFLLPIMIIWRQVPTAKYLVIAAYMLVVGFVMFQLFDPMAGLLFQVIAVFAAAPIFYFAFFKKGVYE